MGAIRALQIHCVFDKETGKKYISFDDFEGDGDALLGEFSPYVASDKMSLEVVGPYRNDYCVIIDGSERAKLLIGLELTWFDHPVSDSVMIAKC